MTVTIAAMCTLTVTLTADGGHVDPTGHGQRPECGRPGPETGIGRVGPDRCRRQHRTERQSRRSAPPLAKEIGGAYQAQPRRQSRTPGGSHGGLRSEDQPGVSLAGFPRRRARRNQGWAAPGPESLKSSAALAGIRVTRRGPPAGQCCKNSPCLGRMLG